MMQVDPACRYCHRKMANPTNLTYDLPYMEPEYLYECKYCKSRQCFRSNGQVTHYQFTIDKYSLCFDTIKNNFKIIELPKEPVSLENMNRPPLVRLDWLPNNLTPFNTSVKKIETLILFS